MIKNRSYGLFLVQNILYIYINLLGYCVQLSYDSFENFAKLWEEENKKGEINYPELAYNQFMKKHGSTEEWYKHKKNIMKELSKELCCF